MSLHKPVLRIYLMLHFQTCYLGPSARLRRIFETLIFISFRSLGLLNGLRRMNPLNRFRLRKLSLIALPPRRQGVVLENRTFTITFEARAFAIRSSCDGCSCNRPLRQERESSASPSPFSSLHAWPLKPCDRIYIYIYYVYENPGLP